MGMKWGFLSCGVACALILLAPTTPSQQSQVPPQRPAPSSQAIRTETRLIAIDVVVTDSHGGPVRGLKKEDFQIFEEHNRQQEIAKFDFIDLLAAPGHPANDLASPTVFSNQASADPTIAPTVLLMDALNTDIANQVRVRQKMLSLLQTLPSTTPVAVFSLSHTLRIVQGFSTDPSVLRAAVDKTLRSVPIEQNPQDDANSPSNQALDLNGGQENQATRALEDFEAMAYEAQMAIRVDETTDAMVQIAKYLGGYAGRKNLVWFSEAFPSWIEPSADFGNSPFNGSASYGDKIRAAAQALTDARIAVYPVDAQGLATDQLYSAAQNPHINHQNAGAGFAGQLTRQNAQHLDQQGTMDNVAETTGGRACKNTNDLAGCVQSALRDGAVYYELGYYPEGIAWDGRFHKILIKTTEHGLKLMYRRGYFATDLPSLATRQNPQDLLKQACASPLPATSIALKVLPIEPQRSTGPATEPAPSRYLLNVSPSGLSFQMVEGVRHLDLQMAICEFDLKGNSFQFFPRDLSRPVPDDVYRTWQEQGIGGIFDYAAKPEDQRLRFAVLDVPSGEMGSLDVPAHPRQFASLPASEIPAASRAPAVGPEPEKTPAQVATTIRFHTGSETSWLDWSGDALSYHGSIGIEQGAPAFFKSLYGAKFHCEGRKLAPNDPGSGAKPGYLLTFQNPAGRGALVELGGDAPAYSGNLEVDSSARRFFDYLWKLCHCQSP